VLPVEINAGAYYLRALRADGRVDDRPDLVAAYTDVGMLRYLEPQLTDLATAGKYVARRDELWRTDTLYSWAVADPTTGRLLGEVLLKNLRFDLGQADVGCWTHPKRHGEGIASTAVATVTRFGFSALDLRRIGYDHAESNTASYRVAERCGFAFTERRPPWSRVAARTS
jgi:RimJ/RimL family protein N-acetyltransferase